MKVLYLTVPSFFDLEISLIRELSKLVDVEVLMILSPQSMHSSAFSINKLDNRCCIIPATEYKGMEQYSDFINLQKWNIANNPSNSLIDCWHLSSLIKNYYKKGGFNLLHCTTNCKTVTFLLPFIKSLPNKILTKHDPIPHDKPSLLTRIIRIDAFHKAFKNLLLLSDALLEPFCKTYSFDKTHIYFSRLSVYDFLTKYPNDKSIGEEYILFFGRIEPYKGVDLLINAFSTSEANKRGIKLVIAGKGQIDGLNKTHIDNVVILNRYIENRELSSLIRNCKFVVLPYRTATQSGCVMSAYAFNKPILVTNVGDLPKEVIDNVTGLVCNPNDVKSLKAGIDQLASQDLSIYEKNIFGRYNEQGELSWHSAALSIVSAYHKIQKL